MKIKFKCLFINKHHDLKVEELTMASEHPGYTALRLDLQGDMLGTIKMGDEITIDLPGEEPNQEQPPVGEAPEAPKEEKKKSGPKPKNTKVEG